MLHTFKSVKKLNTLVLIGDGLAVVLAFFIGHFLRSYWPLRLYFDAIQPLSVYLTALPLAVALLLLIFATRGLYQVRRRLTVWGEIYLVSQSVSLWILIIMAGSYLVKYDYSRIIIVLLWFLTLFLVSLSRLLVGQLQQSLVRQGIGLTRVLIVGAGRPGKAIAQRLRDYRKHGYQIVGFIDDKVQSHEVIGGLGDLFQIVAQSKVNQVYFADPSLAYQRILNLVSECPLQNIEFKVAASIFPLVTRINSQLNLEQIPSVSLVRSKANFLYKFSKRLLDIILATSLLLLSGPLWLVIYFLIKLDSPGQALLKHKRIGFRGQIFMLYKFRTMKSELATQEPAPTTAADSRVTRSGRWLRRTSVDELPQLLNVLKGEMSIVGPRPEMPFIVAQYDAWQRVRLETKPGLTGLWQILGRKNIPLQENMEYDFYYVNNQGLWLDIVIILRTIPQVIFGKGAF